MSPTSNNISGLSGPQDFHPATLAIHGDDHLRVLPDVAPPIHVSTTFSYSSDPEKLIPAKDQKVRLIWLLSDIGFLMMRRFGSAHPSLHLPCIRPHLLQPTTQTDSFFQAPDPSDAHVYSRETAPTTTRLESLLEPLIHAPCVCYGSGLAALHALYIFLCPKRIAIGGGYHGSHGVLALYSKVSGAQVFPLDCSAEELGKGDVIHLETPINPTGEALSISKHAQKAKQRGAILIVDSTFGPPGLQDPFVQGADVVMHSGTKYLGGHSDLLWGVLATRRKGWVAGLREERTHLGSVMGGLESWLGVRSLRSLEVRVGRQSSNAERLTRSIAALATSQDIGDKQLGSCIERVCHASLQKEDLADGWLAEQMPGGFGPVFAIVMKSEAFAKRLPSKLRFFHHATSLGGAESLIEWRAMSDKTIDPRLVRISVGLEHWEDLRDDLYRGFTALQNES